jgi:hypothetical protein
MRALRKGTQWQGNRRGRVFAAKGVVVLKREAKKEVEGMYLLGHLFLIFVSSEVQSKKKSNRSRSAVSKF